MQTVKEGEKVKIHYTGSLDDGTVFDSSQGRDPLEFTIGSGQVIKGFDKGVLGMKVGEEKDIHIPAAEAYGEANPQLIRKIPKASLPKDREPQVGMIMGLVRSDGVQAEAKIIAVTEEDISVDLNHPLAGEALNFKIKLISIN
ncbi:peptidylprolyl isomerase [Candidatus Woesearchaeota archaeon]|nr:peptidylprolyl isomerase [Candidatus Woesearchaeota archaeon]